MSKPIARARKPVEPWEQPYLRAMGAQLKLYRRASRMTWRDLRAAAGISDRAIRYYEAGQRRPRPSTLLRIARAMAANTPALGDPEAIMAQLLELAGPAVAPESTLVDRIEKRRDLRVEKLAKDPDRYLRPPRPRVNWDLVRRMRIAEWHELDAKRELREAQAENSSLRVRIDAQARDIRLREEALEAAQAKLAARERALREREEMVEQAAREAADAATAERRATVPLRFERTPDGPRLVVGPG